MFAQAIKRGLVQGSLTFNEVTYACAHSPIASTPVLSADGGGFTQQQLVTIVIDADLAPAGTFKSNRSATLLAADGVEYSLRITGLDTAGNPYFHQLTARHEAQGA